MEEVCLNSAAVLDGNGEEVEDEEEEEEEDLDDCEAAEKRMNEAAPSPTMGLEFSSFEEAYDFYNAYAKGQGFGIRVSNSWFRAKRRERYRAKLSCSSAGFKKKSEANNPRPETRTGCPAMVVIRLVDAERWRIVGVELQHNHQVSPLIKRFYKSHKRMILAANKAQRISQPVTEVRTIKLYRTATAVDSECNGCSVLGGEERPRHLELGEGDFHAVYNFFCRMKLMSPDFFYLMDVDEDGRLRNVFWADARARAACSYFFDAVAIDTSCLAGKYEIPLVCFVGVNHHGQSVLLGCGFLGHESVECFVWMLRAWMSCMLGCSTPRVVVMDQTRHLQAALSEVIPNARHCYCLWYILQRVPEKLGGLKGFEAIKRELSKTVYGSLKISEFETSWADMINRHGLADNKWLQNLYEERRLWVPVYLKDVFFAGLIPMNENEGMTGFFDGYIHKHTSVKEFVDKYDLALHRKHMKEVAADEESRNPNSELKMRCNFEVQLSKVYTKEIFKRFQSEVEGMYSCFNTRQVNIDGAIVTYVVKERVEAGGNEKEVRYFEVLFETTQVDIRCICSLFNYKGYLCRHALNVLNYNGVEEIPARYVLPRWSRDYKCRYRIDHHGSGDSIDMYNPMYLSNHLNKLALPVVEEGAKSQQRYKTALQELEALLNKLSIVEDKSL